MQVSQHFLKAGLLCGPGLQIRVAAVLHGALAEFVFCPWRVLYVVVRIRLVLVVGFDVQSKSATFGQAPTLGATATRSTTKRWDCQCEGAVSCESEL